MKVSIIQPDYSMDSRNLEKCFYDMLEQIKKCDDSMDIIVLPEYCDVPANTDNCKQFHECIEKYNEIIKNTVIETAKRCNAIVFANFADKSDKGWINTTFAFDRKGNLVGKAVGHFGVKHRFSPLQNRRPLWKDRLRGSC